ncbi:hypothetical protein [Amycolatopsis tucumanensis]|uniref:hypothetical protein n=1 Tax=Amycolatopsis tucumanensis TaxID=401106 RepID=UPI003D765AB5
MAAVDDAAIMDLVRTMCTKLSGGADPRALFESGVNSGFSESDWQAFMAMSAALHCPANSSKVTYDAVGWHPGDKPKPKKSISEGTFEVGVDIEAGKYKGNCPNGGYWARYADDSGNDIIANDLTEGASTMQFTARKGEFVSVSRCTFTKVN